MLQYFFSELCRFVLIFVIISLLSKQNDIWRPLHIGINLKMIKCKINVHYLLVNVKYVYCFNLTDYETVLYTVKSSSSP